jgi:hypothetical protein
VHAAGAGAVHLLVRPNNQPARSLYERAGFEAAPRRLKGTFDERASARYDYARDTSTSPNRPLQTEDGRVGRSAPSRTAERQYRWASDQER